MSTLKKAVSGQPLTAVQSMWQCWTKWQCDRFFWELFGFNPSVSFHQCSIPIFHYMFVLPEGHKGKAWENSKKVILLQTWRGVVYIACFCVETRRASINMLLRHSITHAMCVVICANTNKTQHSKTQCKFEHTTQQNVLFTKPSATQLVSCLRLLHTAKSRVQSHGSRRGLWDEGHRKAPPPPPETWFRASNYVYR